MSHQKVQLHLIGEARSPLRQNAQLRIFPILPRRAVYRSHMNREARGILSLFTVLPRLTSLAIGEALCKRMSPVFLTTALRDLDCMSRHT